MALAYLTINLDAFTGDDHPPVPSYSTITLDPGVDHIDAANDVIHVRSIVVSLDRQGKAATANGVPCVDGRVPVVAGVAYAVSAPNILRGGPHYIPALTAGQVVDLSDYITPGAPLTPDQAATLAARIVALEEAPPGVTDHGALTGLLEDDHTQYALADGTRGAFAAPLGADDNYVTDAEKAALHAHSNKAALDLVSGTNTGDQTLPTWTTISGKPAVVAAGATQADARTAIGAGTSSLALGTTAGTALDASTAPELIRDTMATALVAGSNVTITPNDGADTITIAASGGGGGGGVSADPGNTATLGTDNLIYVPKAIGIEPGASTVAPNVNINGRAGGNVNATTYDRVISHYNPEAFACDEIALFHRSGNVSATYRLAIWSGYPNPGLVFTTPQFSVPTTGEAVPAFTVPSGTVFPRGVWYIGFVLTSGTSGTFNSGGRDTSFEPNRDLSNAGAIEVSNFGVVGPGWVPPAALTFSNSWAAGALPQLLAKNVRFV